MIKWIFVQSFARWSRFFICWCILHWLSTINRQKENKNIFQKERKKYQGKQNWLNSLIANCHWKKDKPLLLIQIWLYKQAWFKFFFRIYFSNLIFHEIPQAEFYHELHQLWSNLHKKIVLKDWLLKKVQSASFQKKENILHIESISFFLFWSTIIHEKVYGPKLIYQNIAKVHFFSICGYIDRVPYFYY